MGLKYLRRCNKDTELLILLLLLNSTNLIFRYGKQLLEMFPQLEEIFSDDLDLTKLGLSQEELMKIKKPNWEIVEQDLFWAAKEGQYIITFNNPAYPKLLKEIQNPPLVLFIKGDLQLLASAQLAIVGSRNPTPAGTETAFHFSHALGAAGFVITSGLALGIDAASHRGAMAASSKTIAVMGTGLNHIYPACHFKLAQEIIDSGGVLISEFPLTALGEAWHFPLRNRIISGLSLGTLVVEATMRSGSIITARLAGEQGREVFAIPGSIYNSAARGCHSLIRQGAKLIEEPNDILEEFHGVFKKKTAVTSKNIKQKLKNKLDREHNKLLDCVGFEIATMDTIALRMGLPVAQVGVMLLELELQGLIQEAMGGYIRVGNGVQHETNNC